jgi:hypothetical protein
MKIVVIVTAGLALLLGGCHADNAVSAVGHKFHCAG